MNLISVDNEFYVPLYESHTPETLSKEDIEIAKKRYFWIDPSNINVLRGHGKLILCTKADTAEFVEIND